MARDPFANSDLVKIGDAARILGVSIDTLRRWEKAGKITPVRTPGGTRLYSLYELSDINPAAIRYATQAPSTQELLEKKAQKESPSVIPANAGIQKTEIAWIPDQVRDDNRSGNQHTPFSPLTLTSKPYLTISLVIISLLTTSLSYFYLSPIIFNPENSEVTDSKGVTLRTEGDTLKNVLAASTIAKEGKFLEFNADTVITGNLAVEGEGIFGENLTAPNIVYNLTAGDNIAITGDPQTPTISTTAGADTLQIVTTRGSVTTTGITLGNVLNLGNLASDPSSATNGATYYNTASNKFRCYVSGSWTDCKTESSALGDITGVSVGNGLSGGGSSGDVSINLDVITTTTTTTTSLNSGLEASSTGLRLLGGCTNNQILKWDSDLAVWKCTGDVGQSGAGIINVQESEIDISDNASTLDFLGTDFDATETPDGEVNITLSSTLTTPTAVAGDWSINGGDLTTTQTTATLFNTTATTLSVGGAATTFNLGTTDSVTRAINLGTGTGVDTINIGTGATGADVITIGSANAGALVINSDSTIAIGSSSSTSITLATDSTGNAELVLPLDSVGPTEVEDNGATPTDEYCLTFETTGSIFEWASCGGSTLKWNALTDPDGSLALSHGTNTTTMTTSATTQTFWTMTGTAFTIGEILDITGTFAPADGSTNEAIDINITHTPTVSADNFRSIDLDTSDGTALANTVYNIDSTLTLTGNADKLGIGIFSGVTSSSTSADTLIGLDLATTVTGIITSGTAVRDVYGLRSQPTAGAESTADTTNVYGVYSKATGDVAALGTVNTYGLYVADGSGDAEGTATNYGIYIEPITGADTNYGICFDCDGTFGTSSIATGISWGSDASTVTLYRSASDILRTGDGFTVDLDLIVSGGDITGVNSAAIDLGEATTGSITFTAGTTGDFLFTLDADTNTQFSASAAPGVDMVTISNSGQASTTDGVDALQLTFTGSNASGNVIDITPSISVNASDTFNVIDIDTFTGTISASGTLTLNGLSLGALTQSETTGTITATAINIGSGWDTQAAFSSAIGEEAIDITTVSGIRTTAAIDLNENNTTGAVPTIQWDSAETRGGLLDANLTGALGTENFIDIDTTAAFTSNLIDITTATAASSGNLVDLNFGNIADTGDAINVSMGAAAVGAQALVVSTSAGVRTQSAIQVTENNTTGTVASIDIDGSSTRGGAIDLDWSGILTTEHLVDIDANSIAAVSIIDITANGLTTGSGIAVASSGTIASGGELLSLSATGITAGRIVDISSAANTLTTGQLVNIASTATSVTTGSLLVSSFTGNSAFTGNLNAFDWSPTSATTASGDLFRLTIGTSGTTTGNLFNIVDTTSSIFSVSEVALTTSLPSNFTSSGDVSIAYDIVFTNPTASYIKSNAPLNITAGELFNASDLTLTTYGYGSVIVDTTFAPIASASKYGLYVNTNSTSGNVADTAYSIYSVNTMLGNAAKVGYGIYSTLTANSTTADTTYGVYSAITQSGASTSLTKASYGFYGAPTVTGANTSTAIINLYGGYLAPSSAASTTATLNEYGLYITNTAKVTSTGTVNSYGLYVADGSTDTTGTSTEIGINLEPQTTADEVIALCFDCDTTFGTQTVATGIQFGNETTTTQNLQIFRSNAAAAAQITIQDEAGTDLMNASTADFQINLGANIASGGQRVCHGGAADSTGLESIGDCNATSVDLAEYYGSDGTLESGDVVIIDPAKPAFEFTTPTGSKTSKAYVTKSTNSYQQSLVGIVSTNPLEILGEGVFDQSENPIPVALVGRVPLKVSTENGPIEPGDYLTSSSIPGVTMKATKPGQVIGKALAEFTSSTPGVSSCNSGVSQGDALSTQGVPLYNCGKIIVFVNPTFADPNEALANLLLDEEGYLVIPKLKTDILSLGNIGSIDLNQTQLTVGTQPIDLIAKLTVIDQVESRVESLESSIATQSAQLASNTSALDSLRETIASLTSQNPPTSTSSANTSGVGSDSPEVDELNLTPPDILFATGSATLADLKVTETLSSEGLLTALDATVSGTFKALSDVFLGTTTIAGDLTVDGTFSVSQNAINVIGISISQGLTLSTQGQTLTRTDGILYLQNSPLAQGLDIFNGKVTIDKDGTFKVETILASEYQVIAGKTSGSGTLAKGTFEVPIFAERVGPNSRILLTPTSLPDEALAKSGPIPVLAVTEKVPGAGFVVSTSLPAIADITFDWWIINEVAEGETP